MFKVLVIGKMHEQGIALLKARPDIEATIILDEFDSSFHTHVRDTDAIAVRTALLPAEVLNSAARLKIVSRHGVGYDSVDVAALTQRGIPLTITADANAVSVAEHAFYMMLSLAKQGFAYDRAARQGDFSFRNSLQAVDLWQKTLLIVGLGRIGRLFAQRAAAFEMRILAYDPYLESSVFEHYQCERVHELEPALRQADVVSLHFPGGGDNVKFIDARKLDCLRPSAILINAARGDIVDQEALYQRLRDKRIHGAGLDVFATEPMPVSDPLLQLDNVIVSPHSAATTQEGAVRMAVRTVQNILDGLDGRLNPVMVVNREVLKETNPKEGIKIHAK